MYRGLLTAGIAACIFFLTIPHASGQTPAPPSRSRADVVGVGDTLDNPPPLAGQSPGLDRTSVRAAMRKVGDWELHRANIYFNQDWTFAPLYAGYSAAAKTLPDAGYDEALLAMGAKFDWKLGPRLAHADDQAIGQTYLDLYEQKRDARMIAPTQAQFDALMKTADDPAKPVWWWCDALFMAPPVWARLYKATGERSYLDYMDHEWWITSSLLYDSQEHLYFRDATFLQKHEANGKKLFWSRGNGWVMAGLARVLDDMPTDYPTRSKYIAQYREMAARIASLQGADGLWRPGLLNADAYKLPEVSGSAFFVYATAWGINRGILDRKTYLPIVQKGWKGLVEHIYVDGRLGCIQPIGAAPGDFSASSSYVYGVGAFLLAGSEVDRLVGGSGRDVKQRGAP